MSFSGFTKSTYLLTGAISAFCGTSIVVSDLASPKETKQVRFPRSKRKRIRRKWEKDRRNWATTSKRGIWQLADGTLVMDPASYAELQESLREAPPVPTALLVYHGGLPGRPAEHHSPRSRSFPLRQAVLMNVEILGVCGKKRHGKDTVGEFLWQDFGFTPIGFADPIKRICMDIYGLSYDQCFGTEADKETVDERWGLTPRYIMQKVGTEMGCEVHKDTWVRYCFDKIDMASRGEHVLIHIPERRGFFPAASSGRCLNAWVITDVRYMEEADSVRARGGKVIKVVRPGLVEAYQDQHTSETNIDKIVEDHLIKNDGTLEALRWRVRFFMEGRS